MAADTPVCEVRGDARALLTAERPALNFLQLLSGTATVTRRHVRAIEGASPNPARLRDPRHAQDDPGPAPGAEVRGPHRAAGANQRLALWDGILDQGEPRRGGRRHHGGAGAGARARGRRRDPGRGGAPRPAARGARRRRHQRPARQLHARADARGGRHDRRAGAAGGLGRRDPGPACGRSPRRASTASRSGR